MEILWGRLMGVSFSRRRSWILDRSVLLASLGINLLSLATPLAVLLVFDQVIPNASMETLLVLAIGLVVVSGLEFLFQYSRSTILGYAAARTAVQNHLLYLSRILNANTVSFGKSDAATHLEQYAAVGTLRNQHAGEAQTLIIDLPFAATFILMIWLVGGPLVWVPITSFASIVIFAVLIKRSQRRIFVRRQTLDQRRYSFLAEVLSNIVVAKANTMERQFMRRFEMLQSKSAETSEELIRLTGLSQSFGAILGQVAVAATGILGAYLVIHSAIGIAELAACMLLNGRVIQPSMRILKLWVQTEATRNAMGKLDAVLALPTNKVSNTMHKPSGRIEFKNVSAPRDQAGDQIFADLTAKAKPGEFVLVKGAEELAIPELFSMILGQTKVGSGHIYLDGYLPQDRATERGQRSIVALNRQPVIFSGTIIENISAFGTGEHVERAKALSSALGLERRVHRLPEGYNTPLNSGSFFERDASNCQLISLVRALVLQPSLLLMDEPSAVLETPEREALSKCLSSLENRPTLLVASPDPRLQKLADQTITLEPNTSNDIQIWEADQKEDQGPLVYARGAA